MLFFRADEVVVVDALNFMKLASTGKYHSHSLPVAFHTYTLPVCVLQPTESLFKTT